MGAALALDAILDTRHVWRGPQPAIPQAAEQPTGHAALDACLPSGGWMPNALNEILFPADGVGELALVWPVLRQLTQASERVVIVSPPYRVHAPGWQHAGIALEHLQVVRADPRDSLWAAEQCLRSGACGAVLCWPQKVDDRALRRLQVAAETGQTLGLAFRDAREARNPSPAALRLQIEAQARQLRVLKCRGGLAPAQPIAFAAGWH